jgi:hypothetical protein
MMVVIIRTKKIIIPIKAFKAMKRVYLILIAIHIGQAPNYGFNRNLPYNRL